MTLVLSHSDVRRLLPMPKCIDLMEEAFRTLARDQAVNPLRWAMRLPQGLGVLGMMPGYMETPPALGLKVVAVYPGNHGTPYDSHQGTVMLFDVEHGFPTAIVDAAEITAIRTAAASGVATRLLAREDAGDLALVGSGVQARSHLAAMMAVRPLSRVRVTSRDPGRREAFAEAESKRYGIAVEVTTSAEEAVRGADIVCTTTSAREPVLSREWIAPGAHINAVGSSIASTRELDTATVLASRLYVDRRESTLNEAGDFLFPLKEGALSAEHIVAELGEVLLGEAPGRQTSEEITLFKSLGLAVEDLAAAYHVYQEAKEQGLGTEVEIGEMPAPE